MAIALGISVCMVTLTSYRAAARIPLPRQERHAVRAQRRQLGSGTSPTTRTRRSTRPTSRPIATRAACTPPPSRIARSSCTRPAACSRAATTWQPEYVAARMTTGDFFPMFETPFLYGGGWNAKADEGPEPVVVLSKETNQKAFGGANSVGKTAAVARPRIPRGRRAQRLGAGAQVLRRDRMARSTTPRRSTCRSPGARSWNSAATATPIAGRPRTSTATRTSSTPSASGSKAGWSCARRRRWRAYRKFLDDYVIDQKSKGRFPRPLNNYLYDHRRLDAAQQGRRH